MQSVLIEVYNFRRRTAPNIFACAVLGISVGVKWTKRMMKILLGKLGRGNVYVSLDIAMSGVAWILAVLNLPRIPVP